MNFKYKKPRKFRSGCHLCKPWKALGNYKERKHISEKRSSQVL